MTMPASVLYGGMEVTDRTDGAFEGVAKFQCNKGDYDALKAMLLWQQPPAGSVLEDTYSSIPVCSQVHRTYLGGDNAGAYQVEARYVPYLTLLWQTVSNGGVWHPTWEQHVEMVNTTGSLYWDSDSSPFFCRQATPAIKIICKRLVLRGIRPLASGASYNFLNQSALDGYAGTVNSDPFIGAAAGQALYHGYQAVAKPYGDGSTVFDVSAEILFRSGSFGGTALTWNHFWREDKPKFDKLHVGSPGGPLVYPGTAYSGITSL
jgi:hypothetical protein